jgi:hypothetical protein
MSAVKNNFCERALAGISHSTPFVVTRYARLTVMLGDERFLTVGQNCHQFAVLCFYGFLDAFSFHLNASKLNDLCVLRDFVGDKFPEICN